jgi:SAM-dependent methyltransferase
MNVEEVLETYDDSYAHRYDESFLLTQDHGFLAKTQFEVELLRKLTYDAASWLDVACGTGYFLEHGRGRSNIPCAGLDLSPAMLAVARRRNPDALLVQGSFLEPRPEFHDRWEIISCMWGAYGLQETVGEIETLVANLAAWTVEGGRCFMPVFDLMLFEDRRVRGVLIPGVKVDVNRDRWSFHEPDGKVHRDMLAPPIAMMANMFEHHFGLVESIPYPISPGQDDGLPMTAIIATKRRTTAHD